MILFSLDVVMTVRGLRSTFRQYSEGDYKIAKQRNASHRFHLVRMRNARLDVSVVSQRSTLCVCCIG